MQNNLKKNSVNLADEYMDVVLALTLEWFDGRLKWDQYSWSKTPVKTLQVDSTDIWTPHIDLSNRIHDYSPMSEEYLKSTIRSDGKKASFKCCLLSGDIDLGDGCWRPNVLMTSLRWW